VIDYRQLYRLSHRITPLKGDCGELCGKACCQPRKNTDLGMYLFPGEEIMFSGRENWLHWEQRQPDKDNFPASWQTPLYFIICTKPCPRANRPLSCRFFPLAPHLTSDGTLLLIRETMPLPYTCPLIAQQTPLEANFVGMVEQCWRLLLQDPRIRDLVVLDSREREEDGHQPSIVAIIHED